jgi:glycosyltransferase involved in cell wall biosynthesis
MTEALVLIRSIKNSKVVIVWFAEGGRTTVLSFLIAKILGRKFITMVAGSEVSKDIRNRGFGIRAKIRFGLTKIILNGSDCVLCLSEFSLNETLMLASPKSSYVVSPAIDTEKYNHLEKSKSAFILSATIARSPHHLIRKGIDRFLCVASLAPYRQFVIGGAPASRMHDLWGDRTGRGSIQVIRDFFSANVHKNVQVKELSALDLLHAYQHARFYCQLSRHEGFGMSVAEAMACKCVPVVSDAGALPEVVGDTGFVVHDGDPMKTAKLIDEFWDDYPRLGRLARDRITKHFSVAKRTSQLRRILLELGTI